MVSVLGTQEVQKTAEDNNFTVNQRAASQAEGFFKSIQGEVLLYLEMMDWISSAYNKAPERGRNFLSYNRNIAAIGITGHSAVNNKTEFFPNPEFINSNNLNVFAVEAYLASDFPADEDQLRLFNASPDFGYPLITAAFVRQGRTEKETVKVLFTPDELSESFGTGTNSSFLINSSGDLLLHSDSDLVLGGANFSSLPIVALMRQEGDNNRQISFSDEGKKFFGAYYRLAGTDSTVITAIPHEIVFEAVQGIIRQNRLLAAAVLFIAILFIWFFSKTISSPVRALADAALRIEGGDFEINIDPQSRDEIGLLTESFDNMSRALSIFGRFTNKDIAVRAMRGEIKPGGLPVHATIFFSDIRGFTEKCDRFTSVFGEDASNRIVLWLNDYFTNIIPCVEKTGGIVDKFIGDGLMAHWGNTYSTGSPAENAVKSVEAALMMRETLIRLNAFRKNNDPGNPEINIGCGINSGMVIAGQIGSEQRMDYTLVGDSVNLASRIESLNKPFGTDILITEDTWQLTGEKFITEEMLPVMIKGKEKPIRVFAVVNYKNSGGPQTLQQLRTLLGIAAPDLSALDIETEEKKFKICGAEKPGPLITMTSFGSSAWVQGPPDEDVPVFFSWNMSNSGPDTNVIVEVAEDREFNQIVEKRDLIGTASISITMEKGLYWWRVYPVTGNSGLPANTNFPSGTLMVSENAKEKKYKVQSL
ncbi:MAG: HAMP domain-containing protein, partial [Treponema sp.]|jgi:adenylate cyclase|nr:HAMP domain-containing protein [Treponema sp.]